MVDGDSSLRRVALEGASLKVALVAAAQSREYHSANWGCSRQSQTNDEAQDLRRGKEKTAGIWSVLSHNVWAEFALVSICGAW
jgi:hypothetical protein